MSRYRRAYDGSAYFFTVIAYRRRPILCDPLIWEHRIRDDLDMERHMDYIHFNPVKHGHVEQAIAWPYSTLKRYVDAGWYPEDWAGRPGLDKLDFE